MALGTTVLLLPPPPPLPMPLVEPEPELTVLREFWLPCGVRFSSVRDGACVLLWWEEAGEGGISPSTFATEEEEGWGRVRKVTLRDLCSASQGETSSSSTSSTGKGLDSITFMIYTPNNMLLNCLNRTFNYINQLIADHSKLSNRHFPGSMKYLALLSYNG